ncbi:MAG: protein kinase [Acidobacteria bacterium]|nr:protein kinase [Acidobacteriota bacterium]
MIDRYELLAELGRSPHAVTTLRVDRETGTKCVVKSLDLGDVDDLKIIEMFHREARVLRGLDHPGIPRLLDAFEERGEAKLVIHLVQEYAAGENLATVRGRTTKIGEEEVVRIARELLAILRYLHSFSPPVIHRDIKPANIILAKDGTVHLIDFSGVRDTMKQDRHPEGGFTIVGSYGYMPFEQYEGRAFPASDIYALGMTMIFILTGLEPIELERSGMRALIPGDAAISKRLCAVLERMIDPDVEVRFPTADDVERALPRPATFAKRPGTGAWVGLGLALAGAIATFMLIQGESRRTAGATALEPRSEREGTPEPASDSAVGTAALAKRANPAWESFEPLAPDPTRSARVAQGLLTYGGQPLAATIRATPRLRIYSEEARGELAAPMRYSSSEIELYDLKPGTYSLWASYWDGAQMFSGGHEIRVEAGRVVQFEFHLARMIQVRGLERAVQKPGRCEAVTESPVALSWDPLEEGTYYDYAVYENACSGKERGRSLLSGSTRATSLQLDLEPNNTTRRYQVNVTARRNGTWIGNGGVLFVVDRPEPTRDDR